MDKYGHGHRCRGHNGWCGRLIRDVDWKAGLRRCEHCRWEAEQARRDKAEQAKSKKESK